MRRLRKIDNTVGGCPAISVCVAFYLSGTMPTAWVGLDLSYFLVVNCQLMFHFNKVTITSSDYMFFLLNSTKLTLVFSSITNQRRSMSMCLVSLKTLQYRLPQVSILHRAVANGGLTLSDNVMNTLSVPCRSRHTQVTFSPMDLT